MGDEKNLPAEGIGYELLLLLAQKATLKLTFFLKILFVKKILEYNSCAPLEFLTLTRESIRPMQNNSAVFDKYLI